MSIIADLTPVHFKLVAFGIEKREDGSLRAVGDFEILNAEGRAVDRRSAEATLSAGEETAFLTWLNAKLDQYATASGGLTQWVEP